LNHWDLIVVGVGAVGSAALRAASEAGARVLGIELHSPAHARGSSHGHSRIFRHAYFEHPEYVPLLRHSTRRFESLERESGSRLLYRCGVLIAGSPDSPAVLGSLASGERHAIPVDVIEAESLRSRFPWFSFPRGAIGVLEANAGIVRPEAAVDAAVDVARRRGAQLRIGTRVHGIVEDETGVTVETEDGRERASSAIVAAGAWAPRLMPELAPLLAVTRQVQAWIAPVQGTDASGMPCWLYDRGPGERPIYGLAPVPGARTGPGSSASPAGHPKVGLHGSDEIVDPDVGARSVVPQDTERIREIYRTIAPSLAGPVADACTCLYTMSPDGQFLVGTRRGLRRTHFAAGLSGHGFKLGPALGDALVDLALHGRMHLPIGFLSPGRFAAPS
jgi:sarcosine oxidase